MEKYSAARKINPLEYGISQPENALKYPIKNEMTMRNEERNKS